MGMSDFGKDDPFTRCVFQRLDENNEWVTFIEVGHYRLSRISEILQDIFKLKVKDE